MLQILYKILLTLYLTREKRQGRDQQETQTSGVTAFSIPGANSDKREACVRKSMRCKVEHADSSTVVTSSKVSEQLKVAFLQIKMFLVFFL